MCISCNAETIRQLVVCDAKEVGKVATLHKIPENKATEIRLLWTRKLEGRCLVCGSTKLYCGHREEEPKTADIKYFLSTLDAHLPILRGKCLRCSKEFTETISSLVYQMDRFDKVRKNVYCPDCRKVKAAENRSRPLTNRPFASIKGVLSEKSTQILG